MFTLKNEISRKCETSLIAYKTIVIIYSNVDLYCKANCKVSQTESGQVDNGLIIFFFFCGACTSFGVAAFVV